MAAGSQLEKGIWALLVIAASKINNPIHDDSSFSHVLITNQCPSLNINAIVINNMTSPIRLVRAVIIPAPKLLALL